jgi:riboflavin-specific deaminase-like protein
MGNLPGVSVNFAITADGKIATRNFSPSTFTSPTDKRRMLELRARHDAVMVGAATLDADQMTLRLPARDLCAARNAAGKPPEPLRVILTQSGRLDPDAKVFRAGDQPPVVYTGNRMPAATRRRLESRTALEVMPSARLDPAVALAHLAGRHGVRRVLCEGGPRLLRSLLAGGLVDTLFLTVAPCIFGGRKAPTLTGVLPCPLPRSLAARLVSMEVMGGECFLEYRLLAPAGNVRRKNAKKPLHESADACLIAASSSDGSNRGVEQPGSSSGS